MAKKRKTIGIALSGGGARGIAHIGVLKALEEEGLEPEIISGASAGAIVGAFYAAGLKPEQILEVVKQASLFKIFKVGLPVSGLAKLTYLQVVLAEQIASDSFEDLPKKLFISIANLNTGACEIRASGPLFEVVTASSSIPLVFQPVKIDGQLYVDGGLLNNLPVEPVKEHADIAVAVNVMPDMEVEVKDVQNVFNIAQRCFDLAVLANARPNIERCDLLVEPKELHKYNIFQINRYQKIYEIGYAAMKEKLPELKGLLD
jgi:NTE family protein